MRVCGTAWALGSAQGSGTWWGVSSSQKSQHGHQFLKHKSTTELWKGSPVPPRHPSLKVALGSLPFAYFFCETLRKCIIGYRAFKGNLPPILCEFFESFPSEPGLEGQGRLAVTQHLTRGGTQHTVVE